jgi:hypothetical protein
VTHRQTQQVLEVAAIVLGCLAVAALVQAMAAGAEHDRRLRRELNDSDAAVDELRARVRELQDSKTPAAGDHEATRRERRGERGET